MHSPSRRIFWVLLIAASPASVWAQEYHHPQGRVVLDLGLGVGVGGATTVAGGVGVGYAVFTGVVPGVRGMILVAEGIGVGGETAGTLTLSPPLRASLVPFVVGEAGRRFEPGGGGWLYGAGGGFFMGRPDATFTLRLGWMFRRIAYDEATVDASGPIVAASLRF